MGPTNTAALDTLREERDKHRAAAIALTEAEDYDPDSEALKAAETRALVLDGQIERLAKQLESQANADAIDGRLAKAAAAQHRDATRSTEAALERARESWGEAFVRSAEFTDYRGRGTSAVFNLDAPGLAQHRALPTSVADLVGAGFDLGKTTVDIQPPPAPTPLLDSITQVPVANNAIEYVKWEQTPAPIAAQVVAEGELKPSVEFKPVVTADTLDTIAVWTQLTRQLIEDAPAVRSMIDQELTRDVQRREEAQAAAALGAAALPTATGADLLAAIRVGIGTVQAAGYSPNAVLLNPADWAELDVAVMTGTLNGPVRGQTFWQLTPIPSVEQAEGTAIVGDFRTAVQMFYRAAVGLYVTDSHADTFIHNVFTLLAERRSLAAVVRPDALVEVTGGA